MIHFHKYVAAGNDFIIFDCWAGLFDPGVEQIQALCDRRFGIGADGILLLSQSEDNDFRMNYFNADGSRGEMCGNGARALVKFAQDQQHIASSGTFLADDGRHQYRIENNRIEVEILVSDKLKNWELPEINSGFINTGVPHIVCPVQNVARVDLDTVGKNMNAHSAHPQGTNLNIVDRTNNTFSVRTWERGVNMETLACGTGATAVSVYINENWGEPWPIAMTFKGGVLAVDFRRNRYWLAGDTELVFVGHIASSKIQSN